MTVSPPTPTSTDAEAAAAAAQAARSDARAKRIAAAVQRSKAEYQAEHAYTERGWFVDADVAGPSKLDRQRVEYASTHILTFNKEEAARALADITTCSAGKPLKSLPKELVATGARAAILAGDKGAAREYALAARNNWRQSVGAAMVSSEALEFAGDIPQATHPLLAATAQGIHYPVLVRLAALLASLPGPNAAALHSVLIPLAESRAWAFARPLFGSEKTRAGGAPPGAEALRSKMANIDRKELAAELGGAERNVLEAALNRVGRALGGGEEEPEVVEGERVERGVREL